MTALSQDVTNPETLLETKKANIQSQSKEQIIQSQKERTLFCINIDQNCSEDILYELFLQVGPIDNIIRKADRNGNIIALVTYKHVESCEYAIKLFNGIKLFNQSLKVQQSQTGNQIASKGSNTNLSSAQSTPNNPTLQNRYSRKSIETNRQMNEPNEQMIQQLMLPPQQQALLNMMSPLLQQFSPLIGQNHQQYVNQTPGSFNRSYSGPSLGENDVDYRTSRRNERHNDHRQSNHHQQHHQRGSSYHQHHHHQSHQTRRDHSNQEQSYREQRRSFNRSRSRSPLNKKRR
ncbi:unnamed protein product [Brachionus calyciflorus]|uniref:RRM domain-containing protein n=1 Tax=Brachionus calyciflorus TaxID=104777 RepID=A0A814E8A3_9BILA|nr:unnamed protein product [Brachionus calyciflorus]